MAIRHSVDMRSIEPASNLGVFLRQSGLLTCLDVRAQGTVCSLKRRLVGWMIFRSVQTAHCFGPARTVFHLGDPHETLYRFQRRRLVSTTQANYIGQ